MVNVGVIGKGGREHALGWNIAKDRDVDIVYYMPGNGGTEIENKAENIKIDPLNFPEIYDTIRTKGIDMLVVGPEEPLSKGIVDFLYKKGYTDIFGPDSEGSLIESDKFFSYDIMKDAGVPQAKGIKCHSLSEAKDAIKEFIKLYNDGVVIKARGLTEGKGVGVCNSLEEALTQVEINMNKFRQDVLISKKLAGEEFSVFGISDGEKAYPIESSFQDHKPIFDNNKGPNTGGMGVAGPVSFAPKKVIDEVIEKFMNPAIEEMNKRGIVYKGFLYAGVMKTKDGLRAIEFNCRFGDPEAQPAMMLMKNGIYQPIKYALEGKLKDLKIEFKPGGVCCVIMASVGYPDNYSTGHLIKGIDEAEKLGTKVFHSGTERNGSHVFSVGGRVLGVTAYSPKGVIQSKNLAYLGVGVIDEYTNNKKKILQYRTDIGLYATKN